MIGTELFVFLKISCFLFPLQLSSLLEIAMFKPGTLVRLAAGYDRYLGWTFGQTFGHDDYPDFWLDKTHIGLMLGNDYDNRHVRLLIGEQVVVINPDALSEISV